MSVSRHTCAMPVDGEEIAYDLRCDACVALRISLAGPVLPISSDAAVAPVVAIACLDWATEYGRVDPAQMGEAFERWIRRLPELAPVRPGSCFCVCRCCAEGDHCGEVTTGLGRCCVAEGAKP